jgi:hypothetical protein
MVTGEHPTAYPCRSQNPITVDDVKLIQKLQRVEYPVVMPLHRSPPS